MTEHRLQLHGQEYAVRTAGEGPVLLLLHGMAASAATWQRVVPHLTTRFTVVAPDLLGHGASAKARGEYSLGAQANVLRDLLVLLGHERATVVGHSYGGGVAMQLAYQFPERCERLVLVGSGGLGEEVNSLLRTLTLPGAEHVLSLFCSRPLRDAGDRIASWLARYGLRASATVEEIWRCYGGLVEEDARRAFFCTLRAVIDREGQAVSANDRLYLASRLPTMLVWGTDDGIIPASHAHAAHDAMPGSRLELFEGAGHYPHCEAPERFVAVLGDFIDSTVTPPPDEAWWHETLRRPPNGASQHPEEDRP